jgi:FtsP/CotA-like multicopper oxidase with cupredoxin domain
MHSSRRSFLRGLASVAGVAGTSQAQAAAQAQHVHASPPRAPTPAVRRFDPATRGRVVPVVTPDVPDMPFRVENGVKVFDLTVEHVRTEFVPGRVVDAWGFNGSVPGPTIQVTEGDRVRLNVHNQLPEPFSMHWHGLEIPVEMDGMPGISQDAIPPGGRFTYEFTLEQNGTFFYHSHMAMQEMMGLIGLFIIHPRVPHTPPVDRDFGIVLQGWAILPNNTIPNSLAMEFNWLTMNGRSGPATTPMICKIGERIRVRLVNLSMDHHPIHMHGHQFYVTGTEGGRIRTTAVQPENTVLVGVAQARDIEFVADNPGDWHLHCHLPHHMMNQMVSMVGPIMMTRANAPVAHVMPAASPPGASPNAGMFPGYPQDMFMVMDDLVAKPETYGLRPGWSGGTMGMMTIIRVVTPELFDRIEGLKAEATKAGAR